MEVDEKKSKSMNKTLKNFFYSSCLGISCDSCTKSNFPGRRYKCLLCDNYDLCGSCFDSNAESRNHKKTHAMQCILTEATAGE